MLPNRILWRSAVLALAMGSITGDLLPRHRAG